MFSGSGYMIIEIIIIIISPDMMNVLILNKDEWGIEIGGL